MTDIAIRYLADVPSVLPVLRCWFESEWPSHYGALGPGNAEEDLLAYADRGRIPFGLVAFQDDQPCGFMALKRESFPSHTHLSPWAGAGYVKPMLRRQGIGGALLLALEREARELGCAHIYCATSSSESLLQRCGWQLLQSVQQDGSLMSVYEKAL